MYQKLLEMDNNHEAYLIGKDVYRTLPNQELFKEDFKTGKNKLFNVLKAYSCYDNEVGYV